MAGALGGFKELGFRLPTRRELMSPDQYFVLAAGLGQKTFTRLGIYLPRPSMHISDRLKEEMPVNQAKIGAQYVDIAAKTKAERTAKLSMAVAEAPLPEAEKAEIARMQSQLIAGKKMAGRHAGLHDDVLQTAEKDLVTRMEEAVRDARLPTAEFDEMKKDIWALSIVGHSAIAHAVLDAETAPFVPDTITLRTVKIAQRVQTQPERLVPPGMLSEFEAVRAEELLHEVPTRILV